MTEVKVVLEKFKLYNVNTSVIKDDLDPFFL